MNSINEPLVSRVQAIKWDSHTLQLLDQRALPLDQNWLRFMTVEQVSSAITSMVVRGAPAIGISAAYAMVLASAAHNSSASTEWVAKLCDAANMLNAARPTAVNLFWATKTMLDKATIIADKADRHDQLNDLACKIHLDDIEMNRKMAAFGAAYFPPGCCAITHCNTGALATGGIGTALGVLRQAFRNHTLTHVYATETRPWLQGSRLTAWELMQDGMPSTLIIDSAAAMIMKSKRPAWVVVGADRIAADGSVANKIGTYSLAVTARHHGVKFMVVAPRTTIDMKTETGAAIEIENRPSNEITRYGDIQIAHPTTQSLNPAFDVTPADLIDVLVTDAGVIEQPSTARMRQVFRDA